MIGLFSLAFQLFWVAQKAQNLLSQDYKSVQKRKNYIELLDTPTCSHTNLITITLPLNPDPTAFHTAPRVPTTSLPGPGHAPSAWPHPHASERCDRCEHEEVAEQALFGPKATLDVFFLEGGVMLSQKLNGSCHLNQTSDPVRLRQNNIAWQKSFRQREGLGTFQCNPATARDPPAARPVHHERVTGNRYIRRYIHRDERHDRIGNPRPYCHTSSSQRRNRGFRLPGSSI